MHLIWFNFRWMRFNIFLALLPIFFGFVFFRIKQKFLRSFFGLLWLLFMPNSIYLFTDIYNLINQWGRVGLFERVVFIFQYSFLTFVGYVTFMLCMFQFEKFVQSTNWFKKFTKEDHFYIILNFIVGFGITLGRVERINSWDVISRPFILIESVFNILFSPQLVLLTLLFGIFGNLVYFGLRKRTKALFKNYLFLAGL